MTSDETPRKKSKPPSQPKGKHRRLSERGRRCAVLIGQGVPLRTAERLAGFGKGVNGAEASRILKHPEAQRTIEAERQRFRRLAAGAIDAHLAVMFPGEFVQPGRGRKKTDNPVTYEQAIRAGLSREVLQVAGLVGPERLEHTGVVTHEHRPSVVDPRDLSEADLEALERILATARTGPAPDAGGGEDGEGEA